MKKLIYSTLILLLTLSFQTAHAGAVEDKVVQLLSSSFMNSDVSSTGQFTVSVDGKETIVEKGKSTRTAKFKVNIDLKLVTDISKHAAMVEGSFTMSDTSDSTMNMTLPFKLLLVEKPNGLDIDSMYIYMYPAYSELAKSMLGITTLDTYNNTWLRIGGEDTARFSDLNSVSNSNSVLTKNTDWFKATVKKVNGQDVYTINIKGDVLLKKINAYMKAGGKRLTASVLKNNREMVDFLKKGKIQVVAQDGNLVSYSGTFNINEVETRQVYGKNNKKVPQTTTTVAKILFKGLVLPTESITIPQARDINVRDFMTELMGRQAESNVVSNLSDTEQTVANKVSKLVTLPTPETPAFFTITDIYEVKKTELGKNKVFDYAQNGDFVIFYEKNNKVVLWRPTLNTVVAEGAIY